MAESFLEYLDAEFLEAAQADGWQPRTDGEGEWALLKIKEAHDRVAVKEAERAEAIKTWDAYVEKETRQARQAEAFFSAKLHGYLLRLREEGRLGRQKGYDLPSGRLQMRSLKDKYEPSDKAALLKWAQDMGYVQFKVEPDMEKIREAIAAGVEVPGMALVRQAHEAFSVQFLTDQKDGA